MRISRVLGAVAVSMGLVVGGSLAPANAVELPWPLTYNLINPKPLDPAIALLPALPTPYTPYTGTICVDGADSCVDDVISEMEQRLVPLAEVWSSTVIVQSTAAGAASRCAR